MIAPAAEEEALLEAIRASTADDGPRLVYADWLLERAEVLGEYIGLACADARSDLALAGRSRMGLLLDANEARWLGSVAEVTTTPRRWSRGLPERVKLAVDADLRASAGDPAWRRVQSLDATGRLPVEAAAALVGDPVLRGLQGLVVVADVLEALVARRTLPRVERLSILRGPGRQSEARPDFVPDLVGELAASPRIRSVFANVPTRPEDWTSLRRPELTLGAAHALEELGRWRRTLDAADAAFAEVWLGGRRGFSRVPNFAGIETIVRRDERGRWSELELRWTVDGDPASEELLAGLATVEEGAFTRVSATGPPGAHAWFPDLVRLLRRHPEAAFEGVLAKPMTS